MRVFTPDDVATATGSKYLGVLVSAKYARELNSLPRETLPLGEEKKLTTRSLQPGFLLPPGSVKRLSVDRIPHQKVRSVIDP